MAGRLYDKAKEYAKYREKIDEAGGYKTSQEKLPIIVGYDEVRQKFIVGPFKIDYLRSYTKVGGEKLVFSGITGVKLYDQNGREIDKNTWTFEYDEATYWEYVDTMNQACAIYLGIGDVQVTLNGHSGKLKNFNWKNCSNSKFDDLL